jgi:hypothetical protein
MVVVAMLCAACSGGGQAARGKTGHNATAPSTSPRIDSPADVRPPRDAKATAALLTRVERALRAPETPASDRNRLGWEQQVGYRTLAAHPGWVSGVRAVLPLNVAPIVTANDEADRSLGGLAQPQSSLPEWMIVAPPAPEVVLGYYREAEAASRIPWTYLAAIHLVESRVGRIRGTSTAGAQGPMQFIPGTWARFGRGDINDNHDAILAAGRFLAATGGPSNMDRALFAYNNDTRYVTAIKDYAGLMLTDERAYFGYYAWQVYYATTSGLILLPEGYPQKRAVKVSRS